jgi:hypothetical protein
VGFPAEQGAGESVLAGELERLLDIAPDARKPLEIAVDDEFAFLLGDSEAPREPPGRNAVEDREVYGLGLVAVIAVGRSEQLFRGHVVDVRAVAKGRL